MNQNVIADFSTIVPALLASGLLPSLCTIRTEVLVQDSIGALVSQSPPVYTIIHADIHCCIGIPGSAFSSGAGTEKRSHDLTAVSKEREVILGGLFDDVTPSMQALVDGVGYNILRVVRDSQGTFTELGVELITT